MPRAWGFREGCILPECLWRRRRTSHPSAQRLSGNRKGSVSQAPFQMPECRQKPTASLPTFAPVSPPGCGRRSLDPRHREEGSQAKGAKGLMNEGAVEAELSPETSAPTFPMTWVSGWNPWNRCLPRRRFAEPRLSRPVTGFPQHFERSIPVTAEGTQSGRSPFAHSRAQFERPVRNRHLEGYRVRPTIPPSPDHHAARSDRPDPGGR